MRCGVVDVGSQTARLVVAERDGELPLPVHTAKYRLRLADRADRTGRLPADAATQVSEAVASLWEESRGWGVPEPYTFATAILRDAPNGREILAEVRARTGVPLRALPRRAEAEATFLAARRWMGWRAGPLLLLDIGGGTLKIASGRGDLPDVAVSLPVGAGRLTREFLADEDPPPRDRVKAARRHVRHQLRDVAHRLEWEPRGTAVATSRTFHQLARLCGAAAGRYGPFAPRLLRRADLREALRRLAELPAEERTRLPGISAARGRQSLAGALVAHTTMKLLGLDTVTLCPWGLREGLFLRGHGMGGAPPGEAAPDARDGAERLTGRFSGGPGGGDRSPRAATGQPRLALPGPAGGAPRRD